MTVAPTIQVGVQCRFCGSLISNNDLIKQIGDESKGYICEECLHRQFEGMDQLGKELTEIFVADRRPECAMCHRTDSCEYYIHTIDGKIGELCPECSHKYMRQAPQFRDVEIGWEMKIK
jgi:hypothetical protein